MENSQTILLTGATGFIGSHLLEALLDQDHKVVILKRSTSSLWRIEHLTPKVKSYDIEESSLEAIFLDQQVDIVVHLATLYRKFDKGQEVGQMVQANVSFPTELVELSVRHGVKGFINTGTFFEYDCSKLPVDENALMQPFNLYAKTKVAFEAILKTYSKQLAINTFRLFSPFGEKDNQKLVPMIINKAINGESVELSEGLQKIDLIYVKDLVQAYIKAIDRFTSISFKTEYEVFNLGSGVALSIRDVVSVVEDALGKTIDKKWGEASEVDIPIAFSDNSKAFNILGWTPKTSIHEGLKHTIMYYKGNS